MESAPSLLKSVVLAITQYNNHKIERNIVFLQRQIDVLISKTSRGSSLKFFNPAEVLPAECLVCLVNLISDPGTKPTLLLKCLLLFNNLVSDTHIRTSLHLNFQITPALASVIKYHGSSNSDTLTAEALHLLQKVTYGHRISFQENFMEDLVRFLLNNVCYPSTSLTQAAMGILVNLTRDNFSVQSYIKNNENMQDLSRSLTKLLGDENKAILLFSLTLLVNMCRQEKMGGKFYNEANAPRTFQMVFNILIDGDSGDIKRYAVDLFKDILKVDSLQRALANYEFLGSSIEQILNLLTSSSPESVVKVFELLLTMSQVDGVRRVVCKCMFATFPIQDQSIFPTLAQTPLSRISDPLLATLHWAGQSPDTHGAAPLWAYDLLIDIYEELVFSHDRVHHEKHAAALLPVVLQTLKSSLEGDNSCIDRKCSAMVKSVKWLLALIKDDNFLLIFSMKIDCNLVAHILQFQFEHNTVAMKSSINPPSDDWSKTGVDLVLQVLDLAGRLKDKTVTDVFMSTLQETSIVPFLAYGLCSANRQLVQHTLYMVGSGSRLEGFPTLILAEALAYNNSEKEKRLHQSHSLSPHMMYPACQPLQLHNKENCVTMATHSTSHGGVLREVNMSTNHSTDSDTSTESIQSLIEKMNSGLGMKDTKASEIISVYERSLQALQTKEQQLQDLLEAKTLALNQADRMLSQYRARKGQDEADANRLRTMLLTSERRCDGLGQAVSDLRNKLDKNTREIEELNTENQKLQQVAQMHQQLNTAHSELAEKYDSVQKSYQTMRQEHQSLSEMHEMLQKHNVNLKQQYDTAMEQLDTLQDERRKVATQLKTAETKLADTTKSALKWEYDYKRSEEERETMDMSIEKLRGEMAKTEAKKKRLHDQVTELEFACNQHEAKIITCEEENRELKGEIDKHRQITALINSLSSGGDKSEGDNTSK